MEDVYLSNVTDALEIRSRAIDMLTDFMFTSPIVLETQASRKKQGGRKSYLYKFNYLASFVNSPDWMGVRHSAEVPFVFGNSWILKTGWHRSTTPADDKIAQMMVTMWTNFAKFGEPTPLGIIKRPLIHWAQFYNTVPRYLVIDSNPKILNFNSTMNMKTLSLYEDTQKAYVNAVVAGSAIVG